eukprot:60811-Chlamydomonas_euryale.AAC.14
MQLQQLCWRPQCAGAAGRPPIGCSEPGQLDAQWHSHELGNRRNASPWVLAGWKKCGSAGVSAGWEKCGSAGVSAG